ncbi:MAG: hypothetical protein H6736_10335 [Alphaproteobacteria bacterium]|nr:hypothetical protein [Alphaproteobacteria bacterium]
MVWLTLAACTPEAARFLVVDGREGEYDLVEREIPELTDPGRMRGELGDGSMGGNITIDGGVLGAVLSGEEEVDLIYVGGRPIRLDYTVTDGLAVPLDPDGVTLWSYYHTLSSARQQLDALGIDIEPVFPVPFSWAPTMPLQAGVSENAAYVAGGLHRFMLLPDPGGARLPLAASPMVIRHELGHAVFQLVVFGGPLEVDLDLAYPRMRDLNEGFADILATLLLDDPDVLGSVFASSIAEPRLVDVPGRTLTMGFEDPYLAGNGIATFAWDIRVATGDPGATLVMAVEALELWADLDLSSEEDDDGVLLARYGELLVDRVAATRPDVLPAVCEAYAVRFFDYAEASACGG